MGQLLKAKKYILLYLLALYIKIKPEKQDRNNFQKYIFFVVGLYIFSSSLNRRSTCIIHKT